jgi:hypothetical protein
MPTGNDRDTDPVDDNQDGSDDGIEPSYPWRNNTEESTTDTASSEEVGSDTESFEPDEHAGFEPEINKLDSDEKHPKSAPTTEGSGGDHDHQRQDVDQGRQQNPPQETHVGGEQTTHNPSSPSREHHKTTPDSKPTTGSDLADPKNADAVGSGSDFGHEIEHDERDREPETLFAKVLVSVFGLLNQIWHLKILGLQWILPRITGTTSRDEGLTGRFYPNEMLRHDEEVLHAGNPSRWIQPVPYVFALGMFILATLVTVMVPLGYGQQLLNAITPSFMELSVPNRWWYAPIVFIGLAVIVLLKQSVTRSSTWHVLTNQRILYRRGVIGADKKRIDLYDVNKVSDQMPMHLKFCNVGEIDVYTAAQGDGEPEVRFHGVHDPNGTVELIDSAMRKSKERVRGEHQVSRSDEMGTESSGRHSEHRQNEHSQGLDERRDRQGQRRDQFNEPTSGQNGRRDRQGKRRDSRSFDDSNHP